MQYKTSVPDLLVALDRDYTDVLTLLDQDSALRRMVGSVPEFTGVDLAWVGQPEHEDRIVLRDAVNNATDVINGLVVPAGIGVGGRVLLSRRPHWESDYLGTSGVGDRFRAEAEAEQVRSMIAVPIQHHDRLLGVLYGATRQRSEFGDRTTATLEQLASRTATAQIVAERARHSAEVAMHEERRRVALELHDSVGAMLFTLGAGIRRLGAEPDLDREIRCRLSILEQQAAEAAAALRGSLRALSAPPEQVALGVALRAHCRAFQQRTQIEARMITLTELPALSAAAITALTDSAREALLNVEKHADAHSVVVSVFAVRDGVVVAVSDDGDGPPDAPLADTGLGLASITERLGRIGGTLSMIRDDDNGFTLQAWVPA
ncbi:GAF domain-containing protein [Nocardia sp. NPDC005998]|uniref:GAF domain-containing sensor histidine kinase n=1 Tax=Nocardia sp. NPDC005998 TaxID=3156894 RepID=UPI0033A11B8C